MSPVPCTAIRFHEYGEPADVLREERVEVADPGAGRVRVRVAAAGLNPADWELCRGFMARRLPRGIGYDVAGTVDAVGDGVDDVTVGDLVFGTADFLGQPSAGAADIAILDSWYRVPDGLDPIGAAVLPMAVQTATWTLDAMGVGPGTTLLVNGAGATVGFAAVQIALRRGARVIATAGTTFSADLQGFGALVTPYGEGVAERVRDLAGGPVDLVFDAPPPNAGSLPELVTIAGDPSRVMTISNHDEARRLGARVNLDYLAGAAPAATFMPQHASLAADGAFRIPIARAFPLAEWRDAVKLSMSGHPRGKVVLLPGGAAPMTEFKNEAFGGAKGGVRPYGQVSAPTTANRNQRSPASVNADLARRCWHRSARHEPSARCSVVADRVVSGGLLRPLRGGSRLAATRRTFNVRSPSAIQPRRL